MEPTAPSGMGVAFEDTTSTLRFQLEDHLCVSQG